MPINLLPHQSLPPSLDFSRPRNRFRQKSSLPPHSSCRRRTPYTACVSRSPDNTKPQRSSDDYHATLRALNSKGRRIPRKSLGQHYMLNSQINEQLASVAGVEEGDVVLEIGPGTGSLTNVLINAGATVLAIEKDPHMAALSQLNLSSPLSRDLVALACPPCHRCRRRPLGLSPSRRVLKEDFVKCHIHSHMSSLLESINMPDKESRYAKVVANIPFNISKDVVKQLLPMGDIFSEVVLLLQEETAVRLVEASTETTDYRPINIFVKFYSDPEYKISVPRTDFFPRPNVDAAIVRFKLKQATEYPSVSSTSSFFSLVNSAFNGKRKMLRKSLQHICTPLEIENALQNVGLPATSRPEELTVDDFVKLHNMIVKL